MSVVTRDRGALAFYADLVQMAESSIDIGVLGDDAEGTRDDDAAGPTNAQIGQWAEFGIGQPRRAWLTGYFSEQRNQIQSTIDRQLKRLRRTTVRSVLDTIGEYMVGEMRARISNGIAPPNAPSTAVKKGSSTPLIDTGVFRSSIAARSNLGPRPTANELPTTEI